ncbi:major facilitator superfamily transporter [Pseudomassariella vexata]|uniref:Major facilitator superfamily transporter n=1 Tax=Pseudomassariella vexata TaxID=1141098 RepID=A0A1Y2DM07_9PEZI|nr:major facilitator superfamily transporter [Pseudomassariella vexata]ORY60290.1 major facilitator superfamily transporter [Pseudomassariella vexata]
MDDTPFHRLLPGTVSIEDVSSEHERLILQPQPSLDPEQPLNWSKARKVVHYGIVCFYALMTFVLLDIGTVVWSPMNLELGISYEDMNYSFASCCAGIAVGCIFFVPLAVNYGRRPVYIVSTAIQLATGIWQAKVNTGPELITVNVVSGAAGAISESIVQITVADLFFVHERATMNGVYLMMVNMGSFLAPVAAGYVAVAMGWRWIWWWTSILLGVSLLLFVFFYEESKYAVRVPAQLRRRSSETGDVYVDGEDGAVTSSAHGDVKSAEPQISKTTAEFPKRPLRERFALITREPRGAPYFQQIVEFLELFALPPVAYTALIWGSLLAWFSVLLTTLSTYFPIEPYNFSASAIGLMNLPPFIGSVIGLMFAPVNDWLILKLARRNGGTYEPEMRLWMALPGVFLVPTGMLVFGLSMTEGKPWIIPAIGLAIFGFGMSLLGDGVLTYVQDCYSKIIGSALVPIAFTRNAFATLIVFALTPWIESMGLENMFITATILCLVTLSSTIMMMIWGRRMRVWSADRYERFAARRG